MTISMDKQYRTRNGREVRIYAVDGCNKCPVHGAYLTEDGWKVYNWAADGSAYPPWYAGGNNRDLIEVKPRIHREYWVNVYQQNYINPVLWETLDEAKQSLPYGFEPIARVKVVIDCEEGQGL